jgi:hypothetical protein
MPVTFYGYPRFDTNDAAIALRNDIRAAARLDGRFGVVSQSEGKTELFCSADGLTQLFYAVRGGALHYGTTVSDVTESAGLDWRWNYEALADLAILGHLVSDHTLHPAVYRVGAAELVAWDGSALSRQRIGNGQRVSGDPATGAIDALLEAVRTEASPGDVISISAGFDSRLILAAFLALGIRPNLSVMGAAHSTDVEVATEIARRFGLHLDWVPLDGARMIADRRAIARSTSGSKLLDSWHTYEYVAAGRQPAGTPIWFGSNGEYARTPHFDRGLQFYAAQMLGAPAVRMFWWEMVRRNAFPKSFHPLLADELRECLRPDRIIPRLHSTFPRNSIGEMNDRLYRERVRQFIANGLRLVSTRYSPRTPFLHPKWIAAVERMPRFWKLGNRWHRHALRQLCPELLGFPYDVTGRPMSRGPGPKYWLGFKPWPHTVPFFDYRGLVGSPDFRRAYETAVSKLKGIVRADDISVLLGQQPLKIVVYFGTLAFFAASHG